MDVQDLFEFYQHLHFGLLIVFSEGGESLYKGGRRRLEIAFTFNSNLVLFTKYLKWMDLTFLVNGKLFLIKLYSG